MKTPDYAPATLVGIYKQPDGKPEFLPMSEIEVLRASDAAARILSVFEFAPGSVVLLLSLIEEAAQFLPLGRALADLRLITAYADASLFDAARTESIIRRYDAKAIFGVNAPVLDGLKGLGFEPATLFAGRVVWAWPDAYARLKGSTGFKLLRWNAFGPAVGMECVAAAGLHIDAIEWDVTSEKGQIQLSSRMPRIEAFDKHSTGLKGRIETAPCTCGNCDPRVITDSVT